MQDLIATILPYAAAGASGLAVLIVLVSVSALLRRDKQVHARLDTYLGTFIPASTADEAPAAQPAFTEKINQAITRRSFAERIGRDLERANLPLTVPEYLLLRAAVPLVLALVAILIWRTVLVVPIALIAGFALPIFWLRALRTRRNRDFNEQLAQTLGLVAGSLRGGFSLPQALAATARESPQPTRRELQRVNQEIQLGVPLTAALDNLVQRMHSDDLDLVVTAIKINQRVGGNLTVILENISTTIRERDKLRREVRVITSMQRLSSWVIGLLPVVLALIILAINPEYMMRLFQPGWTLCIPIGAAVSSVIGFIVIQRMVDIKV